MKRLFGILGNAIFWTTFVLALVYLRRWPNGELYCVMILLFVLGFVIGGNKSEFSLALLEAGRHLLKGWRALQLNLRARGGLRSQRRRASANRQSGPPIS